MYYTRALAFARIFARIMTGYYHMGLFNLRDLKILELPISPKRFLNLISSSEDYPQYSNLQSLTFLNISKYSNISKYNYIDIEQINAVPAKELLGFAKL